MATVNLTTTPVQIDDGTSYSVLVTNTDGSVVELSRGGRLQPNQSITVYPEGAALTAATTSGTGTVTTSTTAAPLPNAADPTALAANAAFTGRYTQKANNLSDVAAAGTARTNLGLGTAAVMSTAQIAADSALTGTYASMMRATAQGVLRPVAWRSNHLAPSSYLAASGDTAASFRIQHLLFPGVLAGSPRLLYHNFRGSQTSPNAITVSAHVEIQSTAYPASWGGQTSVTIPIGGYAISDPLPVTFDYLDNHSVYTTTFVTTSSGRIPVGVASTSGNGEGNNLATGASANLVVTSVGATPTSPSFVNGVNSFSPTAILGVPSPVTAPSICVAGDSIAIGTGDSAPSWSQGGNTFAGSEYGWPGRVCSNSSGPTMGLMYNSCYGESAQTYVTTAGRAMRGFLFDYCTDVIECYGTNDVNNSRTAAQMEADRAKIWRDARARGRAVWALTTVPRSTSTDSWATVGNQTAHANDAARTAMNDWLRAGAPLDPTTLVPVAVGTGGALVAGAKTGHPLVGYFDAADAVESARNSGLWKAANTADGVHPNSTAHAAIAAAVPAASFGQHAYNVI